MYKIERWEGGGGAGSKNRILGRCGHMTNEIHVLHMRSMYKIDRKGGGPKIVN